MRTAELSEPGPMLTERFESALEFAFELHRDQARKTAPDEPRGPAYVGHLLGVAAIVIDAGGSEDQAIAALLHDAAEDQGGSAILDRISDGFGENVALIVRECSDALVTPKPPWRERKQRYLEHLEDASLEALLVSLADKIYNVRSILLDHRAIGEKVWERFNPDADVRWYYVSLASEFRRLLGATPLVTELEGLVDRLAGIVPPSG